MSKFMEHNGTLYSITPKSGPGPDTVKRFSIGTKAKWVESDVCPNMIRQMGHNVHLDRDRLITKTMVESTKELYVFCPQFQESDSHYSRIHNKSDWIDYSNEKWTVRGFGYRGSLFVCRILK